jgi:hypothetical protein
MTDLCADCEHMKRDNDMRARCYSPQLVKLGVAGILTVFERDEYPEPDRTHQAGTGKCGPQHLNHRKREAV